MKESGKRDVMAFVRENDVKFIRLAFCDHLGVQKNLSLQPGELERAFESGIPFDASQLSGFGLNAGTKLLLRPDADTLSVLPWRPSAGRVIHLFCDLMNANGTPYEGDTRALLRASVKDAAQRGYHIRVGSACEFYLFRTDEYGDPTHIPHDQGTFLDIAPADRGENVRRDICLTLYEMGMVPESSHHAAGPGQNEVVFRSSDALSAADHFITFKAVVKQAAAAGGLFASFMPRPLEDAVDSRLTLSFEVDGEKGALFENDVARARSFVAGVLSRLPELTAFLKPISNSYDTQKECIVGWSELSGKYALCIPGIRNRIELSAADPSVNPYLIYALLIRAGLEGIAEEKELLPMEQCCGTLHGTLRDALAAAEHSAFCRANIPEGVLNTYISNKRKLIAERECSADPAGYDTRTYFEVL